MLEMAGSYHTDLPLHQQHLWFWTRSKRAAELFQKCVPQLKKTTCGATRNTTQQLLASWFKVTSIIWRHQNTQKTGCDTVRFVWNPDAWLVLVAEGNWADLSLVCLPWLTSLIKVKPGQSGFMSSAPTTHLLSNTPEDLSALLLFSSLFHRMPQISFNQGLHLYTKNKFGHLNNVIMLQLWA